jgi:hypothetical protein
MKKCTPITNKVQGRREASPMKMAGEPKKSKDHVYARKNEDGTINSESLQRKATWKAVDNLTQDVQAKKDMAKGYGKPKVNIK